MNFLIQRGDLDARDAIALVTYRAEWKEVRLLGHALGSCRTFEEKQTISEWLHRYMALEGQSAETWRELTELLRSHSVTVPGLAEQPAINKREEPRRGEPRLSISQDNRDWTTIFASTDLSSPDGIAEAYHRFKEYDAPWHHEQFFEQAFSRVKAGNEADFVHAVGEVPDLNLYHLRTFLERIPSRWKERLSVKTALAATTKSFCRRYCLDVSRDRHYSLMPFDLASELSGLPESDLIEATLSALGGQGGLFSSSRLFSLVGLLAEMLTSAQALESLSFGLSLFDSALEERDGDGAWSSSLAPPANIEAAVAGYIWGGLASPRNSTRWESAHAARGLCTLGRTAVIRRLMELAEAGSGGPFADARLHFYRLHARQWLLIAVARAAKETPAVLAPHAHLLTQMAMSGELHVLIRQFAGASVLALVNSGLIQHDPGVRRQLEQLNVSPFPVIESTWQARTSQTTDKDAQENPFYFDIDAGTYWFSPLGRCFGLSEKDVEREVRALITAKWQNAIKDGRIPDERIQQGMFREGDTYDSRSYPSSHDLRFYLTYHATMVAAGHLLATVPVHRDPGWQDENFPRWLASVGLGRADGNWLADRRDPLPTDQPGWKDHKETEGWRWSTAREDSEAALYPGTRMVVWGDWIACSGQREESVTVRSALVSHGYSESLLRALQTAGPHDYRIPSESDELEIDHGPFRLKGWVKDRDLREGLDESDPWAGKISYPPLEPAGFVVDQMHLQSDVEHRIWVTAEDGHNRPALHSETWGQWRDRSDEEEVEHGTRLQASPGFLAAFLRENAMDLIIKVQLDRRLCHRHYSRSEYGDFEYLLPNARLFLFKADGTLSSL